MSNNYIKNRLKDFNTNDILSKQNALKQVIQEIILCCLEKTGFFKEVAFCGGTCLRIFYNLKRFSEDLDFSLVKPNNNFNLQKYLDPLPKLLKAFGLEFKVEKYKLNKVQSAFLKGETKLHLLRFFENDDLKTIRENELTKIKLEIDTNPPLSANFLEKAINKPITSFIKTYDPSTLFAGKVNAILTRMRLYGTVKGRDLYDFVFYIKNKTKLNIKFLNNSLLQYKKINDKKLLTIDDVKDMLYDKFKSINYKQAKEDVLPFINDEKEIKNWSANFFINLLDELK